MIGRSGAGYDKIDVAACTEHDVAVFNARLALNHSTASSALLFMLALAKRLDASSRPSPARVAGTGKRRSWAAKSTGARWASSAWGTAAANWRGWRRPFEMQRPGLLAPRRSGAGGRGPRRAADRRSKSCSPRPTSSACTPADGRQSPADWHARAGADEAERLFHQRRPWRAGRPVAPGRGAGRRDRLPGPALDVYDHEPLPLNDPLIALDNVILTPHWSASTTDVFAATGRAMVAGMLRTRGACCPRTSSTAKSSTGPGLRPKSASLPRTPDTRHFGRTFDGMRR